MNQIRSSNLAVVIGDVPQQLPAGRAAAMPEAVAAAAAGLQQPA